MASVGLQIACLSSFAPNRAKLFPKIGFYAMLAGNICNFVNGLKSYLCLLTNISNIFFKACIAGMWYRDY